MNLLIFIKLSHISYIVSRQVDQDLDHRPVITSPCTERTSATSADPRIAPPLPLLVLVQTLRPGYVTRPGELRILQGAPLNPPFAAVSARSSVRYPACPWFWKRSCDGCSGQFCERCDGRPGVSGDVDRESITGGGVFRVPEGS